jgi:uncharacterized protein (DUF4415 family)
MKKVYDFSNAKRGAVIPAEGKTRITIYLDDAVIEKYKARSEKSGKGYQTLINDTLRESLGFEQEVLTPMVLRKILREELLAQSE